MTPEPVSLAERPASRGTGVALLALLVGIAASVVGGWSLWQVRQLDARDQQRLAQLESARGEAQAVALREQRLSARLAELPAPNELEERQRLLASLQGEQQRLSERLESVLGASRQDWRLAEAEHLLRLAALRLSALQDIESAQALVQAADDILREQNDPSGYAARQQLAKSLEALRTLPRPDRTGLFLQLGALREQAAALNPQAPVFENKGDALSALAAQHKDDGRWAQWLAKLSEYFRIDFDADRNIRPLLAGQSLDQVRLTLSLALEQAQWGALHGEAEVYRQALSQARGVLDAHFNRDNPESRALRARLDDLEKQPVAVATPDLSGALDAVQAYLQHKQAARDAVPVEPEAAEAGEAP
nr:uroporphyrinogen-III C-methyltransferase [Pseudomonas sp. RIT-PI-AD]